jgi:hypothetical protein
MPLRRGPVKGGGAQSGSVAARVRNHAESAPMAEPAITFRHLYRAAWTLHMRRNVPVSSDPFVR